LYEKSSNYEKSYSTKSTVQLLFETRSSINYHKKYSVAFVENKKLRNLDKRAKHTFVGGDGQTVGCHLRPFICHCTAELALSN
jgi:hypothetical protein